MVVLYSLNYLLHYSCGMRCHYKDNGRGTSCVTVTLFPGTLLLSIHRHRRATAATLEKSEGLIGNTVATESVPRQNNAFDQRGSLSVLLLLMF